MRFSEDNEFIGLHATWSDWSMFSINQIGAVTYQGCLDHEEFFEEVTTDITSPNNGNVEMSKYQTLQRLL